MAECAHLWELGDVEPRMTDVCAECVEIGSYWLHLRVCLTCGHVGCCDSSPSQHARRHYEGIGHAIIASYEPDEIWRYCYADGLMLTPLAAPLRRPTRTDT